MWAPMVRRYTTDEWVAKAISVHGDRYNYSRVDYKGADYEVIIGCEDHGWFEQKPRVHANQGGHCQTCMGIQRAKKRRLTTAQFITQAREIHGDKYDYSRTIYRSAKEKIIIGCRECGKWYDSQTPSNHTHKINRRGCPDCGRKKVHANRSPESYHRDPLISQDEFILRVNAILGDSVDTSMTKFTGVRNDVEIRCVRCDIVYSQRASRLLIGQMGCHDCRYERYSEKRMMTTIEWITRAREKHGNDFDYSEVEYTGKENRVIVTCNICETRFHPQASVHLSGLGSCPGCRYVKAAESRRIPMSEILERCIEVHGTKYEYPWNESQYKSTTHKMPIICKEHGMFEMTPIHHYDRGQGCTKCLKKTQTRLYEFVKEILPSTYEIEFDFKHKDLRFSYSNRAMELDIWVPQIKLAIEYQGEQHFFPHWSTRDKSVVYSRNTLSAIQERDEEKRVACNNLGITLVEIDYTWDREIESVKLKLSECGIAH